MAYVTTGAKRERKKRDPKPKRRGRGPKRGRAVNAIKAMIQYAKERRPSTYQSIIDKISKPSHRKPRQGGKRPKWEGKGRDPRGGHPARPRGPRPKWRGKGRDPREGHPSRPKPRAIQTNPSAHLRRKKKKGYGY